MVVCAAVVHGEVRPLLPADVQHHAERNTPTAISKSGPDVADIVAPMELSPPNGRTQWAVVAVLTVVACALRWSLAVDGALDVDAINLGLAARDFDVLQYRPHPPGYAGYVLLLKMLGLLAPGAAAVELACLGSLVCGAASVPAAYWAARQMAGADAWSGPLAAAALAAVNPVLWYYGADGQSHAAEGLATLLVFGLVVRAHHRHTRAAVVLAVAALALAGGLRPNIVALGAPLAVWLLWRRPAADWFLSLGAAALACLAWAWPSMAAAGGLDSYRRASEALYGAYLGSYSVGGELAVVNLSKALWSLVWAGPPLLVLCWRGLAAAPWRLPWLSRQIPL